MIYFESKKEVLEFISTITSGTGIAAKIVKIGSRYAVKIGA
jgi:hypothetical protein